MSQLVSVPGRAALICFECSRESLGIEEKEDGESNELTNRQTDGRAGEVTASSHCSLFTSSDSNAGQSSLWCVGDSHIRICVYTVQKEDSGNIHSKNPRKGGFMWTAFHGSAAALFPGSSPSPCGWCLK